ncbi:MAG: hypothetical protein MUC92_02005 [Fimbriimonadaceae bacterium]|jgi:hypothetical protein|nr:hypothetical protein [Fimbriimonadaceae bacterium]
MIQYMIQVVLGVVLQEAWFKPDLLVDDSPENLLPVVVQLRTWIYTDPPAGSVDSPFWIGSATNDSKEPKTIRLIRTMTSTHQITRYAASSNPSQEGYEDRRIGGTGWAAGFHRSDLQWLGNLLFWQQSEAVAHEQEVPAGKTYIYWGKTQDFIGVDAQIWGEPIFQAQLNLSQHYTSHVMRERRGRTVVSPYYRQTQE